jgi:hypothetical protein
MSSSAANISMSSNPLSPSHFLLLPRLVRMAVAFRGVQPLDKHSSVPLGEATAFMPSLSLN